MKAIEDTRILVVEDDPFFQRVLHKRLASEGYQVVAASDGREGMKAIVTFEPDLVISDWMMPHVDGLELCQSVKTGLREAAPYFILLTAKGEISDKLLGLETGADDYLVKPCDQGELMARVRAGLRIVLLTQDLRRRTQEMQGVREELEATRASLASANAGLVPVCAGCGRVHAGAHWQDAAAFLADRRRALPAGHVCPDCTRAAGDHGRPDERAA